MLTIKNISKVYSEKNGMQVVALDDVSLTLPNKGLIAVLGKSGSGKSTLMNVIGTLDNVDEGSVIYEPEEGRAIELHNLNEKEQAEFRNSYMGFVFQDYDLIDEWTVEENLRIALDLQNHNFSVDEKIAETLKFVDLEGLNKRYIKQLSGGQQQRVALARAIIKKPSLILADEPTGNLDSENSRAIAELLKKYSENSLVVIVTHDNELAEQYADRIIKLKDGKVVEDIEKNAISDQESNPKTYFTTKRLSLGRCFKLALNAIAVKKIKLIFTVLAVSLAIFAIKIIVYINTNDFYRAFAEEYSKRGIPLTQIYTNASLETRLGFDDNIKFTNSREIYTFAVENFGKENVYRVVNDIRFENEEKNVEFWGSVTIGQKPIKEVEFIGRLPEKQNEIAITDYLAANLRLDENPVGQTIRVFDRTFTITGIIIYDSIDTLWPDTESFTVKMKNRYRAIVSESFINEMLLSKVLYLPMSELGQSVSAAFSLEYKHSFCPVSGLNGEYLLVCGDLPEKDNDILFLHDYAVMNMLYNEVAEEWDDEMSFEDFHHGKNEKITDGFLSLYDYYPNINAVGVIAFVNDSDKRDFILSDAMFEKLRYDYWTNYAADEYVIELTDESRKNSEIFRRINDKNYFFDNHVYGTLNDVRESFKDYMQIQKSIVYLGCAMLIILLVIFVSFNVRDNHKKIGILMSLGVTQSDINKIWNMEAVLLCVVADIITEIGCLIAICKINEAKKAFIVCDILSINPMTCIAGLILLIILGLLLVAVPLVGMSKEKPIKLINKR